MSKPRNCKRQYPYGVSKRDRKKPWIVKFVRMKKRFHVGSYYTLDEATEAAAHWLDTGKALPAKPEPEMENWLKNRLA
jgi:hypothetical protein